ncbi:MAG: hypothetical protein J5I65_08060 [Aridibacter famidurans]|nr:hypothetical protein [Aridibacter famidurans]
MAIRKDPWKQIGRPAYSGVHLMPMELEKRAAVHEKNRERVVAKILADLFCMVKCGHVLPHEPISLGGAEAQSLRGSRTKGTEAAHCAPRQLYVGAWKMQFKLDVSFPERGLAIAALFGETDLLPANFNKADSRLEDAGMAEAFLEAAKTVVLEAPFYDSLNERAVVMAVRKSFYVYRQHTVNALNESLRQLRQKVRDLDRSRIKHSMREKEERKWREQFEITKIYGRTLDDAPGLDEALEVKVIRGLVRIYEEKPEQT